MFKKKIKPINKKINNRKLYSINLIQQTYSWNLHFQIFNSYLFDRRVGTYQFDIAEIISVGWSVRNATNRDRVKSSLTTNALTIARPITVSIKKAVGPAWPKHVTVSYSRNKFHLVINFTINMNIKWRIKNLPLALKLLQSMI